MSTQTTDPLNHLFPTACPACEGVDRCDPDTCICPTCYTKGTSPESLEAWRTFAPVMAALNLDGAYWGWSTGTNGKHSVEVGNTVDIVHRNGQFIVSVYRRTRAATYLEQEQGEWVDGYVGPDAETAAASAIALAGEDRL